MDEFEKVIWLSDIGLTVDDVKSLPEYGEGWAKDLMHVALHVADASPETLREAFMILASQPTNGPANAHAAIVGAELHEKEAQNGTDL